MVRTMKPAEPILTNVVNLNKNEIVKLLTQVPDADVIFPPVLQRSEYVYLLEFADKEGHTLICLVNYRWRNKGHKPLAKFIKTCQSSARPGNEN